MDRELLTEAGSYCGDVSRELGCSLISSSETLRYVALRLLARQLCSTYLCRYRDTAVCFAFNRSGFQSRSTCGAPSFCPTLSSVPREIFRTPSKNLRVLFELVVLKRLETGRWKYLAFIFEVAEFSITVISKQAPYG